MADLVKKPWVPTHSPPELILKDASIVDVANASIIDGVNLHLKEGRVVKVDKEPLPAGSKLKVIDVQGKFICPGLIDCHVHLTATAGTDSVRDLYAAHPETIAYRTAWNAKQMLLRGFTTVRDTAGATFALRDAIAEGLVVGPRLFISGKALSQTGGHGDLRQPYEGDSFKCCGGHGPGIARICDGVPACLEAARDELRQGADFLKIMVGGGVASPVDPLEMIQFTAEEIQAITTSARNLNKIVTAHAYTNAAIRHAVSNGVMAIEHANFIDRDTSALLAEKGISVTPTLVVYKALITPPFDRFLLESGRIKCQRVLDSGTEGLKILEEAEVDVCYGTDLLAGMHVQQNNEFGIRARALSNIQVLRSATVNAAKLLGMEGEIGTLAEGAFADLLILGENPLEDVRVLGRLEECCLGIMKEGRVVLSKVDGLEVDGAYG